MAAALAVAGCIAPEPSREDNGTPNDRNEERTQDDVACAPRMETPTGTGPGQASVSNQPGAFSYSGQSAAKTGTETFAWQNPSNGAQVMWGGQTGTGTLTLTLFDACGTEVYRKEFGAMSQGGAMESTDRAQPGNWWIEMEFVAYTGQIGLQVTSG